MVFFLTLGGALAVTEISNVTNLEENPVCIVTNNLVIVQLLL